ncbi:MAG: carbon storage regulator CsrA [Clostridia bacterium]|nr:carbon storage regulator CsrA [Clostridia bacterium]
MLVLSRKVNESVTIGDDVRITILSIESDRVKLGIEAPKDMRVYRYETVKKVQVENQTAANVNVNIVGLANMKNQILNKDHEDSDNAGAPLDTPPGSSDQG